MTSSDRPAARVVTRANGDPLSDELIGILRERVRTRYYDSPDVIEATARLVAARGSISG